MMKPQTMWMLSFSAMLIVACSSRLARGEEFRLVRGLSFSKADPGLTLDLYLPKANTPVPCIITIQGGGFLPQDGQRFKPFAEHLANNGLAAALISYRGRPDHKYRDTLADVKDSVRFVRSVAEQYGIDASRMGATGRSAGGTLAALLAVTGDADDPQSQIQAAVCFAGVFDFVRRFTDQEQLAFQPNAKAKLETNGQWIGAPFAPQDQDWLAASAMQQLDRNDPPMLLLHSRDDSTVPWLQSRDMHQSMTRLGIPSEIVVYERGGHAVNPQGEHPLDEMVTFFRQQLR